MALPILTLQKQDKRARIMDPTLPRMAPTHLRIVHSMMAGPRHRVDPCIPGIQTTLWLPLQYRTYKCPWHRVTD